MHVKKSDSRFVRISIRLLTESPNKFIPIFKFLLQLFLITFRAGMAPFHFVQMDLIDCSMQPRARQTGVIGLPIVCVVDLFIVCIFCHALLTRVVFMFTFVPQTLYFRICCAPDGQIQIIAVSGLVIRLPLRRYVYPITLLMFIQRGPRPFPTFALL